jgi:predicted ATPase
VGVQVPLLAEREHELERLGRLLAQAREGSGGAVVFEGPAGIGKSSLLAAARAAAEPAMRVLAARGGELERELPFGVVRQLLEPVVAGSSAAERELLLAGAAALARPVLFSTDPGAGAEPSFSALHGLYWLTVNLADSRPLLVAVDDAHWADTASLRWLLYLARRLVGVPLALVLATRPGGAGPAQELLDELLVSPEISVFRLGGLSEEATARLATQLLDAEPEPRFVTASR